MIWRLGVLFIEMIKLNTYVLSRFLVPLPSPPAPFEDDMRPINCKYNFSLSLLKLSLKVDATIISGCDPQIMCASYVSGKYRFARSFSFFSLCDTTIYRRRMHENENNSQFASLIRSLIISR